VSNTGTKKVRKTESVQHV